MVSFPIVDSHVHVNEPGRSEWDPETLEEHAFDFEKSRRIFRESNARFRAALDGGPGPHAA